MNRKARTEYPDRIAVVVATPAQWGCQTGDGEWSYCDLIGYLLKDLRWASWAPDAVPMAVSTAVAIISLAVAFLLRWSNRRNGHCK